MQEGNDVKREQVRNKCATTRVSSKQSMFFFSVRTETNRNLILFSCLSVCFTKPKTIFFGLFRCFGPVSEQPKQTEKISKKRSLLGGPRNKPKLNLIPLFFGLFFRETKKKIRRFVSVFRIGIETTETNRTDGTGNLKSLYFY
jgi:hypothetical protein